MYKLGRHHLVLGYFVRTWTRVLVVLLSFGGASLAAEAPPRNSFLAASNCAIGHCSPAQQDSYAASGPLGPTRTLSPSEMDFAPLGQLHMAPAFSGLYPNGRRVIWSNGVDRIAKVDYDSFEVLSEYFFPGNDRTSREDGERYLGRINAHHGGIRGVWNALRYASTLGGMAGIYTLLDVDHNYYIGATDGTLNAYAEVDPADPASSIVLARSFRLPDHVTGSMVGMNMTFDGWLIVATEHGWVVAISRDFKEHHAIQLRYSEGREDGADESFGWIRNGFAVDSDGGIFIASQDHLHKVVWTGSELSVDESSGAWVAGYPNATGRGTGATPSLMGFGAEEDHLVVISDGEEVMNVTLFWRDGIPEDWPGLEDEATRRIAGRARADLGDASIRSFQTEQSQVVAGNGVLVVNNTPRNRPWYLPESQRLDFLVLLGLMGSNPEHQPFGVQKFEWNSERRAFSSVWVNREISSPNGVPGVSMGSGMAYLVGAREDRWVLEGIDWETGESRCHWVMGDQRYNGLGSAVVLDERGRIQFGGSWGRVRLNIPSSSGDNRLEEER